jgi:hypothetical protein
MLILIENSFSAEKAILPAHYAPSDENWRKIKGYHC